MSDQPELLAIEAELRSLGEEPLCATEREMLAMRVGHDDDDDGDDLPARDGDSCEDHGVRALLDELAAAMDSDLAREERSALQVAADSATDDCADDADDRDRLATVAAKPVEDIVARMHGALETSRRPSSEVDCDATSDSGAELIELPRRPAASLRATFLPAVLTCAAALAGLAVLIDDSDSEHARAREHALPDQSAAEAEFRASVRALRDSARASLATLSALEHGRGPTTIEVDGREIRGRWSQLLAMRAEADPELESRKPEVRR